MEKYLYYLRTLRICYIAKVLLELPYKKDEYYLDKLQQKNYVNFYKRLQNKSEFYKKNISDMEKMCKYMNSVKKFIVRYSEKKSECINISEYGNIDMQEGYEHLEDKIMFIISNFHIMMGVNDKDVCTSTMQLLTERKNDIVQYLIMCCIYREDIGHSHIEILESEVNYKDIIRKIEETSIRKIEENEVYKLVMSTYTFLRYNKIFTFNNTKVNLNLINDEILQNITQNKNNAIFETVGDNWTQWHHENIIRKLYNMNYKIYCLLPVVEDDIIKIRQIERTEKSFSAKHPIIFNVTNLESDNYKKKIGSIYSTFSDLISILNELHIYDNRSYRAQTNIYSELNYKLEKFVYVKNMMECKEGMCIVVQRDKKFKEKPMNEKNISSTHYNIINALQLNYKCEDVITTNILYFMKMINGNSTNSFDLLSKCVYSYSPTINKTEEIDYTSVFRKTFYTNEIILYNDGRIFNPNFFELSEKCTAEYSRFTKEMLQTFCKKEFEYEGNKFKFGDLFGTYRELYEIDTLNMFSGFDNYLYIKPLINSRNNIVNDTTKFDINKNDFIESAKRLEKTKKQYKYANTLPEFIVSTLLYEIIWRACIKNKIGNDDSLKNRHFYGIRVMSFYKDLYNEENKKLVLNPTDNRCCRYTSTSPFVTSKQVVNYGFDDWNEYIDENHAKGLNEKAAESFKTKYAQSVEKIIKASQKDPTTNETAIFTFIKIPWTARCTIKTRYHTNIDDPERGGQTLEICTLPGNIQSKFDNDDNGITQNVNLHVMGYDTKTSTTDLPTFYKSSYAKIAHQKYGTSEEDFENWKQNIPKYFFNYVTLSKNAIEILKNEKYLLLSEEEEAYDNIKKNEINTERKKTLLEFYDVGHKIYDTPVEDIMLQISNIITDTLDNYFNKFQDINDKTKYMLYGYDYEGSVIKRIKDNFIKNKDGYKHIIDNLLQEKFDYKEHVPVKYSNYEPRKYQNYEPATYEPNLMPAQYFGANQNSKKIIPALDLDLDGGNIMHFNKYMKYKNKYMNLKNNNNI